MRPRTHLLLLALSAVLLAPGVWRVGVALPAFGEPVAEYGPAINALGPVARHVANMVSAVNFDFRGFDTVGEEYMLLAAVSGAVMLLRGSRGENSADKAGRIEGRAREERGDSTILISRVFAPVTMLFGVYVCLHATVTPGGGFQGGVIIASSLLLVYLGEGYFVWRRFVSSRALDVLEGGGASVFVLAGLAPVLVGRAFLENVLPLGAFRDTLSGGLMLVENAGVAFAVSGGFSALFVEFLEETRALKREVK